MAALASLVLAISCSPDGLLSVAISAADTPTNSTFRAIKAIDDSTVWAAGSGNTVARTTDGGESWDIFTVGDSLRTEFRSLMAWDANTALVFTIDSPAVGYRTDDAGRSWKQVYYNASEGMFIDSVCFLDDLHGVAVGDPIDGRIFVITTSDGGRTWTEIQGPENPGGMFAASNTCVTMVPPSTVLIAASSSQVHILSQDNGWRTVETPIARGADNGCDGCYGIRMLDSDNGFLYGGNYEYVTNASGVLAYTSDGGSSWVPCENGIHGFVSALEIIQPNAGSCKKGSRKAGEWLIASGSDGISICHDGASAIFSGSGSCHWESISALLPDGISGYHALSSTGTTIWAAGSHGHIARIHLR